MEKKTNKKTIDDFNYLANAASAMDCTGLIPSLPQTEEELESYNDIVQYCSPTASNKAGAEIQENSGNRTLKNAAGKESPSSKK